MRPQGQKERPLTPTALFEASPVPASAAAGRSDAGLCVRWAAQQVGDVTAEKAEPGWLPPLWLEAAAHLGPGALGTPPGCDAPRPAGKLTSDPANVPQLSISSKEVETKVC